MRNILRRLLPAILSVCLLVCLPLTTACGKKEPEPYEFTFVSNGDGTCYISHVDFREDMPEGELTLVFPAKSPEGDTVTAIRYKTGGAVPLVISDEDFLHGILQPMMKAMGCEEVFDSTDAISREQMSEQEYIEMFPFKFRVLLSFYGGRDGKRSIASQRTDSLKRALIARYPFLNENPEAEFWVFDRSYDQTFMLVHETALLTDLGMTPIMAAEAEAYIGYTGRGDAVNYHENIVAMEFPDTLTEIEGSVFGNCPGLRSLVLPDGVKITGELNSLCDFALESVKLSNSITTIGEAAFAHNMKLTDVTIPDSVTAIGNYAFSYCDGLTNITIPDSVISIGEYAFGHYLESSVRTEIYYEGTLAQWNAVQKCSTGVGIGDVTVHCTDGDLTKE